MRWRFFGIVSVLVVALVVAGGSQSIVVAASDEGDIDLPVVAQGSDIVRTVLAPVVEFVACPPSDVGAPLYPVRWGTKSMVSSWLLVVFAGVILGVSLTMRIRAARRESAVGSSFWITRPRRRIRSRTHQRLPNQAATATPSPGGELPWTLVFNPFHEPQSFVSPRVEVEIAQ